MKRVITALTLFFLLSSYLMAKEWNIIDFGAKSGSETVNTKAIQQTIDACAASGGGTVIIENGSYISGTVLLKNNVTLNINENAKLIGSDNPNDYISIDPFVDATGQLRGKCLVGAIDVRNIAITGKGVIDGRGDLFTLEKVKMTMARLGITETETADIKENSLYSEGKVKKFDRPFLVRLVRCKNILLKDIHLRQPAAWTLHFFQCAYFKVDGIDINSHANANNDAIDIDSSNNGFISNCTIDSGDDAICFKTTSPLPSENVVVTDCTIKSEWGAIKFGTESMGDFRNITVKNCTLHDTRGGGIKILSVDGAKIENILIDRIKMVNVEMPIFIRLGERCLVYRDAPKQPVGSINNVCIKNVTATTPTAEFARLSPGSGVLITGTPNHKIGKVTLQNIKIKVMGGGTEKDAQMDVPELEIKYPEFSSFGITPAYGLYARHIQSLKLKGVDFELMNPDKRDKIVFKDVN